MNDIGIIEPSDTHHYQPLWTLVGGGCVTAGASAQPQASVMPQGVGWIKDRACEIDPEKQRVSTEGGVTVGYDHLVVCPDIQLDWNHGTRHGRVPGLASSVEQLPLRLGTQDVGVDQVDAVGHRDLHHAVGADQVCPLTTARDKMLLAEFDYTMQPTPSIPFIDTTHERRDMWLLKRYGLPAMYWNLILKGRA